MSVNGYKHFSNTDCPYFPCHETDGLNCMFCYCPLYHLQDCGGDFCLTENGVKDCSKCELPHQTDGWDKIVSRLKAEACKKSTENKGLLP